MHEKEYGNTERIFLYLYPNRKILPDGRKERINLFLDLPRLLKERNTGFGG
jgi:hypothetical protein